MPGGIEVTPKDELTGLPLPVLSKRSDLYFQKNGEAIRRDSNFHHHFHPINAPELGYDEFGNKLEFGEPGRMDGLALRYSRGQELPVWLHDRYHNIFNGPQMPVDEKSKFTLVVLACAGVVPREAINLYTPGEWQQVTLDDRQHDFIRRKVHYEGAGHKANRSRRGPIGSFLANYALKTPLAEIVEEKNIRKKIDEFLNPSSKRQRHESGAFILKHAIGASVADLIPLHQEAQREGMVKSKTRELGRVVLKYFTEERFPDYFGSLEDQLSLVR